MWRSHCVGSPEAIFASVDHAISGNSSALSAYTSSASSHLKPLRACSAPINANTYSSSKGFCSHAHEPCPSSVFSAWRHTPSQ